MVNLREIVDGVFQGDVISKMSQGTALKSLAYKTVKSTYEEIMPPLDEQEAYFITEQFMDGWLSPLLSSLNKQPEESKDEDKIRENTDFDKEDGVPDKIGEFDVLNAAKLIGRGHISEVVAGRPLTPEKRERLMSIKKKFSDNGKSLTATLGAVVDAPNYINFIKHALISAALYLNVDEPSKIRRDAKTGDFDEMGLFLDDVEREREEASRPKVETEESGTFSDKFKDMYKSDWFNLLKRDD